MTSRQDDAKANAVQVIQNIRNGSDRLSGQSTDTVRPQADTVFVRLKRGAKNCKDDGVCVLGIFKCQYTDGHLILIN